MSPPLKKEKKIRPRKNDRQRLRQPAEKIQTRFSRRAVRRKNFTHYSVGEQHFLNAKKQLPLVF